MRNFVLITLDSLRADHCGFMGYPRNTTPFLDGMARNGLCFENAMVASLPTTPSMTAIFTGEYPLVNATPLVPSEWRKNMRGKETLSQKLSEAGYTTGAFHTNPAASQYFGLNKGFETFEYLGIEKEDPTFSMVKNIQKMFKRRERWSHWESYYKVILDWVRNAPQPYFLWILLIDTHVPYFPPKRYREWGSGNWLLYLYLNWKITKADRRTPGAMNTISGKEQEMIKNLYDCALLYGDDFIGRLWEDIGDTDPVFVVHADHGDGLGEHGFYWHPPLLYEELIHVPLVIYNAGINGKVSDPVSLLGLSPTILELAGIETKFVSRSLLHTHNDWVVSKVLANGKESIAIRMNDWKYIVAPEGKELYNLRDDRKEKINLVRNKVEIMEQLDHLVEKELQTDRHRMQIRKRIKDIKLTNISDE